MKTQGDLHQHKRQTTLTIILFAVILAGCATTQAQRPLTGSEIQPGPASESSQEQEPGQNRPNNEEQPNEKAPVDPTAMTAAHNHWRSQVGVPQLTWSEKLVNVAQDWADTLKEDGCGFHHSHNGYGENLFKASPLIWSDGQKELQDTSPEEVTNSWGNEIKYYEYSDNSCSGVCGHYTQVVWKETTEVGCARSVCDDKSQIWVCSYSPAGNMAGKRPY
ncbi:CAP domain-containing protein [Candidatus Electrothrix sp.]|uniref:CAP domain-containing protein n=2 Tax=Candidatus Electrothrix sp. TaxID=2170559 RepID=UPI0040563E93